MDKTYWIAGDDGHSSGPFDEGTLRSFLATGRARPDSLVCEIGQSTWTPLSKSLGLGTPPPAVPPMLPRLSSSERLSPIKEVDVMVTILISILTLGIWGLVWFHEAMTSYRSHADSPERNQSVLFWCYVGSCVASILLSFVFLWWLPALAGLPLGTLLLARVLDDRDRIAAKLGGLPELGSRSFHIGLWLVASILAFTVVGIVIAIPLVLVQAVRFLRDHNRIAAACAQRAPSLA